MSYADLKPWAQWLMRHRMYWLVVAFVVLLIPLYLVLVVGAHLVEGVVEAYESWWSEFSGLLNMRGQ